MTQSDRWNIRSAVARYWAFKDELQRQAAQAGFELDKCPMIIFYMPMPKSWSQARRRQMAGQPHQQRPDIDNCCKGVLDSLVPDDDADIYFICAAKFWSDTGAIEIKNLDRAEVDYILVRKDIQRGVIE
jgi:Holliday junction resolvase RusA-like endonuclease